MAVALALAAGCSRRKEPTDADIVKAAIQRAIGERCNIITPSIGIGAKISNDDGSWTYLIRYQCAGLAQGGKKREMTLRLAPSKGGAGSLGWKAI